MIYLPEFYYFQDTPDFPSQKAFSVTTIEIGKSSKYYQVKLHQPKYNAELTEVKGELPADMNVRIAFLTDLIEKIFRNIDPTGDPFDLCFDVYPVDERNNTTMLMGHHDTLATSWFLNISPNFFSTLQQVWHQNDLPSDLFYPEDQTITIPYPINGIGSFFLRVLGGNKMYTPLQWQHRND